MLAAPGLTELHDAGNFLTETNAAGAVYATRHVGSNQRTEILVDHNALDLLIARCGCTIADCEILQLAFAALIANGAIKRVIDKQKFHHALLGSLGVLGAGLDLHALGGRRGARRQWLRCFFNLHQAHAAIGGNR